MKYNAEKGYGLKLTKFDEQYEDCIIYRDTKEEIIRLADNIIRTFNERGIMEELNTFQSNAYCYLKDENDKLSYHELFEDKFKIPSYFINLLLEKHNMKVIGW